MPSLLRTENVGHAYGIHDVSLNLNSNEIVSVLGPNGSGKTTLCRLVSGLLWKPKQGEVFWSDRAFHEFPYPERPKKIGYLPPHSPISFPIKVWELVSLGFVEREQKWIPSYTDTQRERVDELLQKVDLLEKKNELVHQLSSGELQRAHLARVWAQDPQVLVLDESLSQLDLSHLLEIGKSLRSWITAGKSVLLVSHDVNFALGLSDRVIVLDEGRILTQGRPSEPQIEEGLKSLYQNPGLRFEKDNERLRFDFDFRRAEI